MALGKQAKILSAEQQRAVLNSLPETRHPERNRVIFLLSTKAGLRAKEIAGLTWAMVTDAEGKLAPTISVENIASKGQSGGRHIPLNKQLEAALRALAKLEGSAGYVVKSERGARTSAAVIVNTFASWYRKLGFEGCSSHSGRRTFITATARKISQAGGSLRDIQEIAGHSSLTMTQRYIQGDADAKRRVVNLI